MPEHAQHFQDEGRQAHAARLGMWVFLASEILLFGALFGIYAASRAHHPEAFGAGVEHSARAIGTINTFLLLTSSFTAAAAVHRLREDRPHDSAVLLFATCALGLAFLGLKGFEYAKHLHEGLTPGPAGAYFAHHPEPAALPVFWTLYWITTGLHSLHVIAGLLVMGLLLVAVLTGRVGRTRAHTLEVGALYWHLVDVVWIFVWPMFYLAGGR